MSMRKLYILAVCLLLLNTQIDWGDASFLDYIWPDNKINYYGGDVHSLPAVPFELAEEKDKFLLDSAKILGNKLSELDFCQQRIILQLKNSCKSLSEEQIGKLALALMNCQSHSEGREIYECSDKMLLKECINSMPSETWSVYNQFLSRAKTICLIVRQDQFRAVAEITVNRLMESTNEHLHQIEEMKTNQKQLDEATRSSFDEIAENNLKLIEKQQEILKLAEAQRVSTEMNLREIIKEKNLVKSGQIEISNFITNLKNKIDAELSEIEDQNANVRDVYTKLVSDLSNLYEDAQKISNKLDEAGESVLEQNRKIIDQIKGTVVQLKEVHIIVLELSNLLKNVQKDFEERMIWLTKYFGSGENFLQVFPVVVFHLSYLLIGMICLIFVNADSVSRAIFIMILCLNLAAVLYEFVDLDLMLLTETIAAMLLANCLAKLFKKFDWKKYLTITDVSKVSIMAQNEHTSRINLNRREGASGESLVFNSYSDPSNRMRRAPSDFRTMTSSRQAGLLNEDEQFSDRSRSTTPFDTTTLTTGNRCKAYTVRGTQCQLMRIAHTDFCRIHDRNSNEL